MIFAQVPLSSSKRNFPKNSVSSVTAKAVVSAADDQQFHLSHTHRNPIFDNVDFNQSCNILCQDY
jgi:hypothetical protein